MKKTNAKNKKKLLWYDVRIIVFAAISLISVVLAMYGAGMFNTPTITNEDIRHTEQKPRKERAKHAVPKRMIIPSVSLGVDIESAKVSVYANEWPLSNTKLQFAEFSPKLGEKKGTLVLYGHNSPRVLRPTNDIKLGDKMTLVDENGDSWHFKLTDEKEVRPEQTSFIFEKVPFRVVVFTCDGPNDKFRRLMYFEPID